MSRMDTPVVDAHCHIWQLGRGDYGWLNPSLAPIYRDVNVQDWRRQSDLLGVHAAVLVQAAPTEAETVFLLAQASACPDVAGVVGWVDWLAPDAPDRIRALALRPKLKGLRPMLQDLDDPDWILQPALDPCLRAMVQAGLVLDGLVKPQHLPRLLVLAERYPDLKVVIDHAAKPDIARGQWQPWADDMARLASKTQMVCKLSGLLTECGPKSAPDAARRWALHVLRVFGPQRVMWGSDWPVLELASSYALWWQEVQALLAPLSVAERGAVLGGNAVDVYHLSVCSNGSHCHEH